MKSIIFVIALALVPVQAHAFGWFLLGMAVGGSGSKKSATYNADTSSKSFIEVRSCYSKTKDKAIIRTSIVIGFADQPEEKRVVVNTVRGYNNYCLYGTNFEAVKAKYFPVGKK